MSNQRLKKQLNLKGRVIKKLKGADLLGLRFIKLIEDKSNEIIQKKESQVGDPQGWKIVPGAYVTEGEGSGIVQLAPAFGEDDYSTAKSENLPTILNVDEEGKYSGGKFK